MKTIAIITFLYFLLCGYATENNQYDKNQVNMKNCLLAEDMRYLQLARRILLQIHSHFLTGVHKCG